jgi:anti-repressor protein
METSIIKIEERDGKQVVNARDLHVFLESRKDFTSWMKNRIEKYGFIEGRDYQRLYFDYKGNLLVSRLPQKGESDNQHISKVEYALSVNMAKELSMVEGNEKGKQARRYFIECEQQLAQAHRIPQSFSEALQLAADQARKIEEQQKVIDYQEPLAVLGDAVMEYDNDITIRELSKILCQNGVDTGEVRLRDQFKVEKYLNQDGLPSQRSIENGWLAIAKRSYEHPKYGMQISRKAMVTPKGQKYFVNKFLKSKQHAN